MHAKMKVRGDLQATGQVPAPKTRDLQIYTDASVVRSPRSGFLRLGLAWVSTAGHWGCLRHDYPQAYCGNNAVLIAELRAASNAWRQIKPDEPLSLRVDNQGAVRWLTSWKDGDSDMPDGYQTAWRIGKGGVGTEPGLVRFAWELAEYPHQIKVRWVPAHSGDPLNEAADSLAAMARRQHLTAEEIRQSAAHIVTNRLSDAA